MADSSFKTSTIRVAAFKSKKNNKQTSGKENEGDNKKEVNRSLSVPAKTNDFGEGNATKQQRHRDRMKALGIDEKNTMEFQDKVDKGMDTLNNTKVGAVIKETVLEENGGLNIKVNFLFLISQCQTKISCEEQLCCIIP
jgi:hypothetical protein